MSKFIGRDLAVGIAKEDTRGVGVAPTHWLNVTNFSFFDRATKARSIASTGGIWGGDQSLVARKYAEGEVECELDDVSFVLILLATLGELSSATYLGANKHTLSLLNSSEHPSLSVSTTDTNSDNIFEMSMVDSLAINFTPETLVTYTVGFKSKSSAGSVVTANYPANNKFLGRQLSIKVASDTSGLDVASKLIVQSATLTIAKNTDYYNVVGSVQPSDINNKVFSISGEMTISFENSVFRDYMLNGDYKAMRFDLVNDDVTIGTTNPSFRIDLSKVDFDAWDVDYALDDIVMQTINFTALYDLGGNDNMINDCYVINAEASY